MLINKSCFIVVPTLNAESSWQEFANALKDCAPVSQILIIDSSSSDHTDELAVAEGFRFHKIPRSEFDHGVTRQLALRLLPEAEILIFQTQDAILGRDSLSALVASFVDVHIGAAYGRQLPRKGATPIESHARLFNYGETSDLRDLSSKNRLGFKSIFISNSFAAYRVSALKGVGGFPCDTIFGEDTITAAKLLKAGWKIAYVAEAQVYHSHSYTWRQEFKRYFDIGVLHSRERWLLDEFGGTGGEGLRFVWSEICYLWPKFWWLMPSALIRTALKLMGYKIGKLEARLPNGLKQSLSMNRRYWKKTASSAH